LANNKEISIKAFQLPIINKGLLIQELNTKTDLKELFEPTRIELIEKLEKILVLTAAKQDFSAAGATQKNLA
jgi:hypothetical protein